jgi:Flp pilus assembly protein TadG
MRVTRKTNRSSSESRPRVGFLSMELVFTLPILMVVLLGLFEFSMLFFARGMVVEAARVGARKASLAHV